MNKCVSEQPVTFDNRRGQRLHGVLHLPEGRDKSPMVVMAHGFTDDKTGDNRLFVKFARKIAPAGIAVLRFDFAGSGDSEGDFAGMTPRGEIEDLKSAIDFVCGIQEIDNHSIILIGYSLGGAVSICTAAEDQRVRMIIGWSPVSRADVTFRRILGENTFQSAEKVGKAACKNGDKQFHLSKDFFSDLQYINPLGIIGTISPRPIFLIQGLADEKVLPEETKRLFEFAKTPKKIHFIEGSGHSFAFFEEELFKVTLQNIGDFFPKFLCNMS